MKIAIEHHVARPPRAQRALAVAAAVALLLGMFAHYFHHALVHNLLAAGAVLDEDFDRGSGHTLMVLHWYAWRLVSGYALAVSLLGLCLWARRRPFAASVVALIATVAVIAVAVTTIPRYNSWSMISTTVLLVLGCGWIVLTGLVGLAVGYSERSASTGSTAAARREGR